MGDRRQRQHQARDERAALFLRVRRSGMTFAAIGQACGLSASRVRSLILIGEHNEANARSAAVGQTIRSTRPGGR